MSQNRVCIRSVFEKKMGPYEVCIFVNTGPFEETAALLPDKDNLVAFSSALLGVEIKLSQFLPVSEALQLPVFDLIDQVVLY